MATYNSITITTPIISTSAVHGIDSIVTSDYLVKTLSSQHGIDSIITSDYPIKTSSSQHGINAINICPVIFPISDTVNQTPTSTSYLIQAQTTISDNIVYKHVPSITPNPILPDGYSNPIILQKINKNITYSNTQYVPDITTWTNLGSTNISMCPIIPSKDGNTIYAIGSYKINTNTIYSASIDAPMTWTNTGKTLPVNVEFARIVRIKDYYYMFGGQGGSRAILIAPYSDPTSWTQIGTFLDNRNNADIIILQDKIIMGPGYYGGTYGKYFIYANVNSPTNWQIGPHCEYEPWESGMFPIGNNFKLICGCSNNHITTYDYNFNKISETHTPTIWTTVPTVWEIEKNKYAGFNFGSYGQTNEIRVLDAFDSNYTDDWQKSLYTLPNSIWYTRGATFIDKNGYLYIFNEGYAYKSGRKLSANPSKSINTITRSWLSYDEEI